MNYKKILIIMVATFSLIMLLMLGYYFLFVFNKSGELIIKTDFPDALYVIDGREASFNKIFKEDIYYIKTDVNVGNHTLTIRSINGGDIYRKKFNIKKGASTEIEVELENNEERDTLLEGE